MDIAQFSFDHLRLTKGPDAIQFPPDEIKSGTGKNAKRKIFTGVPFDNFEKQQIKEVKTELIERGITLPSGWSDADTLKYLYSSQFEHEKVVEKIKECMEWRNNPASYTLTKEVLALYETGALYIYGRDRQYRPMIVFDFGKVDFDKTKGDDFNAGISMLLDILINYCFVPGKVENIIILIDTRKISLTKVPITPLKNWFALGSACFPNIAYKTYVLGPPFVLRMSWKLIEAMFDKDTAAKIEILSADDLKKMHTQIDPSQLEEKHSGNLPNLITYWPPKSTFATPTPALSQTSLRSLHEIQEMSVESPQSFMARQPANLPSHNFYHSLPVSQNKMESPTPKAVNKSPIGTPQDRPSRNQIFDRSHAPFRGSHSPMRVKEGEEALINDIISHRITPTVPNFNLGRSSAAPSQVPTHVYLDLSPSYLSSQTPKERVKKSALLPSGGDVSIQSPSRRSNIGGSSVLEPIEKPVPYLQTGNPLIDMILREDKYLRTADPDRERFNYGRENSYIPDEFTQVDQMIGGRRTAEARLKQHIDYSPENRRYTSGMGYNGYEKPYEDLTQRVLEQRSPNRQEMQKSRPMQPHHSDWNSDGLRVLESSYGSIQSLQRKDREMSRRSQNDEYVEDWSQRKIREIPKSFQDEEEEEDEVANFCGLCVSKRKNTLNKKH